VARAVIAALGHGTIRYVEFPEHLRGRYQSFTEADISRLRAAGYRAPFAGVEEGVARYLGRDSRHA
jgi:ADP-L-glycero-D-manno-heptose 6-epimerase